MGKQIEQILQLKQSGYSYQEIGDQLGLSKACVRGRYRRASSKIGQFEPSDERDLHDESFQRNETQNTCTIHTRSTRIRTVEDALKYAEIDTDVWDVDSVQINSWEIGRKDTTKDLKYDNGNKTGTETDSGGVNTQTLWQVKVKLKKKVQFPVVEAFDSIIDELKNNPPTIPSYKNRGGRYMMEISLVDHHFGKMCVSGEGLEHSEKVFMKAVDNLLFKSQGFDIEQIVVPLGSDFFHIDNKENKTANGTPQDVDGHITDIYKAGCRAVVESIYKMVEVAPVKILYIPGNHDHMTSFYLCEFIKAWFNNTPRVTVDTDKLPRKYEFYGKNLIGYTHGKEEKINDLPRLIMGENINNPEIHKIEHMEFHKGHFHKKKETQYVSGDTLGNVRIIELPSLSGTDFWHYSKGYVGAKRAAEAYIYDRDFGNVGHFVCDIKELK